MVRLLSSLFLLSLMLFLSGTFFLGPKTARDLASAESAHNCGKILTNFFPQSSSAEEKFLSRYFEDDGIRAELLNDFTAEIKNEFPALKDYELSNNQSYFGSLVSIQLDEILLDTISEQIADYKQATIELDQLIKKYAAGIKQQIMDDLARTYSQTVPSSAVGKTTLFSLISDRTIPVAADHKYALAHLDANPADHIAFIRFNSRASVALNRDPPLRKRILNACQQGLVVHAQGSNGIKRIDGNLYEIKDVSLSKRFWGCLEGNILWIKGVTNHKGIHHVQCS